MSEPRLADINPARRQLVRIARAGLVGTVRRASASRRSLPQFLILGAQRSGTTSLWRWLEQHPHLVSPLLQRKGVHYFDLEAQRPLWWYRAHFPLETTLRARAHDVGGSTHEAMTAEASPYYLFHPRAPAHVAEVLPATQFVVLLRDPVKRAVSHYHHMRDEGTEPLDTLEAALAAEHDRLDGAEEYLLASRAHVHEHHLHRAYVARGMYADQLERWFAAVGRERVLVLDGGRLRTDGAGLIEDVCRFVGLSRRHAPSPSAGRNAGSYPAPADATLARLRATFAEPDERLWDLLGERWW